MPNVKTPRPAELSRGVSLGEAGEQPPKRHSANEHALALVPEVGRECWCGCAPNWPKRAFPHQLLGNPCHASDVGCSKAWYPAVRPVPRSENLVLLPCQLSVVYRAFDAAWRECAPDYEGSATSIEAGRLRLANAVLAAYQIGVREAPMITASALRTMRPAASDLDRHPKRSTAWPAPAVGEPKHAQKKSLSPGQAPRRRTPNRRRRYAPRWARRTPLLLPSTRPVALDPRFPQAAGHFFEAPLMPRRLGDLRRLEATAGLLRLVAVCAPKDFQRLRL